MVPLVLSFFRPWMMMFGMMLVFAPVGAGAGMTPEEVDLFQRVKVKAEQGDVSSQFWLGRYYYYGEGVAKDMTEGIKWWRKAAFLGNASAQFHLGICYYTGRGVPKDNIEAHAYLSIYGATDPGARKSIEILESEMTSEDRLKAQQRAKELQKEIAAQISAKKEGK